MKKNRNLLMLSLLFILALAFVGCVKEAKPEKCTSHSYEVSVTPTYDTTGTLKCKNENCDATETLPALKDRDSYYESTSGQTSYTVRYKIYEDYFSFEQSYYVFEDINNNEVALVNILGTGDNGIIIPSEFNGKKVTKLCYSAFELARNNEWQLFNLSIPSTVTEIEDNTLVGLTWIRTWQATTVEFPLNFTMEELFGEQIPSEITFAIFNNGDTIKTNTLRGSNVGSVRIPKTVKTIEADAFKLRDDDNSGCYVEYEGTVADWLKIEYGNEQSNPFKGRGGLALKDENNEWKTLTELVIPDGVTEIKDYTFGGLGVSKVVIPDSVEYIGKDSFSYSYFIETVVLGKGVKSIGYNPFGGSEVQNVYYIGEPTQLEALRKNFNAGISDNVFYYKTTAKTYYYSEQPNLSSSGYEYWRYDTNGKPDVWDIKWQDYYFGDDKYIYEKTEVEITNEAWAELTSKKGSAELNALLNNNTAVINAFNESANKEEFKSKVEAIFTIANANFEIQFNRLGVKDYFTDSRTDIDYNFEAVSVEGVFGAYSYNDYKLYLTEVQEGVILFKEQGYIININHIMNINE